MGRRWGRTLRRTVGHGGFTMTAFAYELYLILHEQGYRKAVWEARWYREMRSPRLADEAAAKAAYLHSSR